jgi:hypothetical protein
MDQDRAGTRLMGILAVTCFTATLVLLWMVLSSGLLLFIPATPALLGSVFAYGALKK